MNHVSTLFLRGVIICLGLGVLALCVFVLPIGLTSDNTGYYKPILLGMYVTAAPFFFALYQALKLLGYIDKNQAFSAKSVTVLKNIKYAGATIGALYAAGFPYIFYAADLDDAPGVVALALVIITASLSIATFAALMQKLLQTVIDIKSENDLTV